MADSEHVPQGKRSVPKVVLGLAAVAVIGPLFLLRRLHRRTARIEHVQLSTGAAPPIRRPGLALSSLAGATTAAPVASAVAAAGETFKPAANWTNFGHTGEEEDDYGVPPPPESEGAEDDGGELNNAFDAFKAITIATTGVGLTAAGIFFGVKSYMGVKTIDEFALRMRAALSGTELNERIDESVANSVGSSDSKDGNQWTLAAAQQRLTQAYDEGGVSRWSEQLAKEAEAEARVELARRTAAVQELQHDAK